MRPARPGRLFVLLVLDGVVFTLAAYEILTSSFLRADTVLTVSAWVAHVAICLAAQAGATLPYVRTREWPSRTIPLLLLADSAVLVVGFGALPFIAMNLAPIKGRSFLWYPLEWNRFHLNLLLLGRSCPSYFPALCAIVLVVLYARFTLRSRVGTTSFLLLALISLWILCGTTVNFEAENLYFFTFPVVFMVLFCLLGTERLFARALIGGGIFASIHLFYMGFIPPGPHIDDLTRRLESLTKPITSVLSEEGKVELLYPRPGEPSLITLSYLRTMLYDGETKKLYVSYGPTSGLASINPLTGKMESLARIKGMMRFLWSEPGEPWIFGLDWLMADLYVFSKDPLRVVNRVDLFLGASSSPSPFDLAISKRRSRLYTVSYERARVEEWDLETLQSIRFISFREMGFTVFNAGGQRCVIDDEKGILYVLLGEVDREQEFRILEIDLDSLSVQRSALLESAGLELAYLPAKHSILTGDFYGKAIYEVDTESFTLRRVLEGPLSLRNLAFDEKREVLYATGFADGNLDFIDYRTGRTLASVKVGPKPSSMIFVPDLDNIFVGSAFGVFRLSPAKVLGDWPPGPSHE